MIVVSIFFTGAVGTKPRAKIYTSYDPVIPFWEETKYYRKVIACCLLGQTLAAVKTIPPDAIYSPQQGQGIKGPAFFRRFTEEAWARRHCS